MKPNEFPEVNNLNLKQCREALALGEANYSSLHPWARAEWDRRALAIQERMRRLEWTEKRIQATQRAGISKRVHNRFFGVK